MKNNHLLKKIVIINNLKHFDVQDCFEIGGQKVSSSRIKAFMAGSQNKNHEPISDELMDVFLNGLIIYMRGSKDEPELLPRFVENYIISQIEAGNEDAIEEIRCLIEDASDTSGCMSACEGCESDDVVDGG